MRFRAWFLGVKDGWDQWPNFGCGITWEDREDLNEAYDRGVNVGEVLACVWDKITYPLWWARKYYLP